MAAEGVSTTLPVSAITLRASRASPGEALDSEGFQTCQSS